MKANYKKYKWTLILACIVSICPIIVGLILWNQLPDRIATHFGSGGEANGWSSKAFTVFGIPGKLHAQDQTELYGRDQASMDAEQ